MTRFQGICFSALLVFSSQGVFAAPRTLAARLQAQISELAAELDHLKARVTDLSDQLEAQKLINRRIRNDLQDHSRVPDKPSAKRVSTRSHVSKPAVTPSKGGYDPNPSHILGTLEGNDLLANADDEIIYRDDGLKPLPPLPSEAFGQNDLYDLDAKPQDFLEEAQSKMQEQDFEAARSLFQKFIKGSSKSTKVVDARFGVGETHFAERNYGAAAKVYLEGYQKHKKAPKAPDFLFKLGQSLERLGKKPEACKSYKKALKEYPKMNASLKRRIAGASKKACPLPR